MRGSMTVVILNSLATYLVNLTSAKPQPPPRVPLLPPPGYPPSDNGLGTLGPPRPNSEPFYGNLKPKPSLVFNNTGVSHGLRPGPSDKIPLSPEDSMGLIRPPTDDKMPLTTTGDGQATFRIVTKPTPHTDQAVTAPNYKALLESHLAQNGTVFPAGIFYPFGAMVPYPLCPCPPGMNASIIAAALGFPNPGKVRPHIPQVGVGEGFSPIPLPYPPFGLPGVTLPPAHTPYALPFDAGGGGSQPASIPMSIPGLDEPEPGAVTTSTTRPFSFNNANVGGGESFTRQPVFTLFPPGFVPGNQVLGPTAPTPPPPLRPTLAPIRTLPTYLPPLVRPTLPPLTRPPATRGPLTLSPMSPVRTLPPLEGWTGATLAPFPTRRPRPTLPPLLRPDQMHVTSRPEVVVASLRPVIVMPTLGPPPANLATTRRPLIQRVTAKPRPVQVIDAAPTLPPSLRGSGKPTPTRVDQTGRPTAPLRPVATLRPDGPLYTPYPPGWERTTTEVPQATTSKRLPINLIPGLPQISDVDNRLSTLRSPIRPFSLVPTTPSAPSRAPYNPFSPSGLPPNPFASWRTSTTTARPRASTTAQPPGQGVDGTAGGGSGANSGSSGNSGSGTGGAGSGGGEDHQATIAELVAQLQAQLAAMNLTQRLPPQTRLPSSAVMNPPYSQELAPVFNSHLNIHGIGIIGGGPYAVGSFGPMDPSMPPPPPGAPQMGSLGVHHIPLQLFPPPPMPPDPGPLGGFARGPPPPLPPLHGPAMLGGPPVPGLGPRGPPFAQLSAADAVEPPVEKIYRTCKDGHCKVCLGANCYDGEFTSVKVVEGCPIAACDKGCSEYVLYTDNCPVCRCEGFVTREPCRYDQDCPSNNCKRALCRSCADCGYHLIIKLYHLFVIFNIRILSVVIWYPEVSSPEARLYGPVPNSAKRKPAPQRISAKDASTASPRQQLPPIVTMSLSTDRPMVRLDELLTRLNLGMASLPQRRKEALLGDLHANLHAVHRLPPHTKEQILTRINQGAALAQEEEEKCEATSDCVNVWHECVGGLCVPSPDRRHHIPAKKCVLNSHCPEHHFCEESTCFLMERASLSPTQRRRWESLAKGAVVGDQRDHSQEDQSPELQLQAPPSSALSCVFHYECPSQHVCGSDMRCQTGGPPHREAECLESSECLEGEDCFDMSCLPEDAAQYLP